MAAKGTIPAFNTLKECMEFLYWLKDDKTGMQSSVANRLKRLLKNRYKGFTQSEIERALSIFLSGVSKFHTKLCKNARGHYLGNKSPRDVLYALLACIPRLLSASARARRLRSSAMDGMALVA
ncbi:hypothetical protein, conserved [Babesia bigemina]|uniref:Uncharacterized protein n=1 Tax=Babesia bigemina TaxID=5866 RepID=A0A061BQV2_BABBI|nr:hypothetical protein, conserved [Babesia bigemina]CDR71843.1 hypothetical protein, conserved [Babesia bigemina]|eukprot:XP_012770786.1 hypothetical protein, conserved [Babesia bigemina]